MSNRPSHVAPEASSSALAERPSRARDAARIDALRQAMSGVSWEDTPRPALRPDALGEFHQAIETFLRTQSGHDVTEVPQEPDPWEFDRLCQRASAAIVAALSERWPKGFHDPEVRANLKLLATAIDQIQAVATPVPGEHAWPGARESRGALRSHTDALIRQGLLTPGGAVRRLDLAAVRQLVRSADDLLIDYGDDTYLFSLAEEEYVRSDLDTAAAVSWRDEYGDTHLAGSQPFLAGWRILPREHEAARRRLLALHRTQWTVYNQRRDRAELKGHFLARLTVVMILILLAFAAAIGLAGSGRIWLDVFLAASAGAVGASLSAAYKMRDTIQSSQEVRAFFPVAVMQPVVGAIAGLLMLLVLESGWLAVETSVQWAAWGAMAFLAGFSEPFFLNVVGRIAQAGADKANDVPQPASRRAGSSPS